MQRGSLAVVVSAENVRALLTELLLLGPVLAATEMNRRGPVGRTGFTL